MKSQTRTGGVRRQRGIALLLALLVLTILILLIGQMVMAGGHNKSVARNATASLQNEYGVLSGYRQAIVRLEEDHKRNPDLETLGDTWASSFNFELGGATVSGAIIDVERRFNLSSLVNDEGEVVPAAKEQLVRLLTILGHEALENAERIVDYVDLDTKGPYEAGARNARLINLQELQRIEGLARDVLFGDDKHRGLIPFVTVWPKEGGALKINPNTAPAEVLQSLDGEITPEMATAIVTWRAEKDKDDNPQFFKNAQDLTKITEMTPAILNRITGRLGFKADAYEIRIKSSMSGVERKELYVVGWRAPAPSDKGTGPGGQPPPAPPPAPAPGDPAGGGKPAEPKLTLLSSMREHEFFDLKPDEK